MTHDQALGGDGRCDGHLADIDSYPDSRMTHAGRVEQLVTLYECGRCRRLITVQREVNLADGTVALAFRFMCEMGKPSELIGGIGRQASSRRG